MVTVSGSEAKFANPRTELFTGEVMAFKKHRDYDENVRKPIGPWAKKHIVQVRKAFSAAADACTEVRDGCSMTGLTIPS